MIASTESAAVVELSSGPLPYTLRRSPRARTLRVVIHPDRGVVVTVPTANRRGWADPEPRVDAFLRDRDRWLRRHLERHDRIRDEIASRGGLRDGARIRYLGTLHRLRIEPAPVSALALDGGAIPGPEGGEVVVRVATADRRSTAQVLDAWFRRRARATIDERIAQHGPALGVAPAAISIRDQRSRWGSASSKGRLAFSWRLILAPPEALETVVVHELAHLRILGHGPRFWTLVASRRPDHVTWRRWLHDHSLELHRALDG